MGEGKLYECLDTRSLPSQHGASADSVVLQRDDTKGPEGSGFRPISREGPSKGESTAAFREPTDNQQRTEGSRA